MIATIALKRLCTGRLACSTVFENPAITMLQLCYNCAIVLSQAKIWWLFSSRQLRYFAHAHKVFCVCPQGVLRMPARSLHPYSVPVTKGVAPCVQPYRAFTVPLRNGRWHHRCPPVFFFTNATDCTTSGVSFEQGEDNGKEFFVTLHLEK